VNAILIEAGLLDPASSPIIGLVVESNCRFYSSLTYPEPAEIGVAVEHFGRSSVRYHLAVFKAGAATAAAAGRYTHAYVERVTNRPVPIPDGHRRLMEELKPSRDCGRAAPRKPGKRAPNGAPHPFDFFGRLVWLDGRPLMETIEAYRCAIFESVLSTFDVDGNAFFPREPNFPRRL
jgi:acyl-CoA thioesterase FadM